MRVSFFQRGRSLFNERLMFSIRAHFVGARLRQKKDCTLQFYLGFQRPTMCLILDFLLPPPHTRKHARHTPTLTQCHLSSALTPALTHITLLPPSPGTRRVFTHPSVCVFVHLCSRCASVILAPFSLLDSPSSKSTWVLMRGPRTRCKTC